MAEGLAGLEDRSSRPHRLRQPTPREVIEKIERLRRQRWTGKPIAADAGVSPAKVSRILRRLGLNKLCALELEPVRRHERENPAELKKLGRIGSVGHRIIGRQNPAVVGVMAQSQRPRFGSPRHEADREGVGDVDEKGRDQRQDDEGLGAAPAPW